MGWNQDCQTINACGVTEPFMKNSVIADKTMNAILEG